MADKEDYVDKFINFWTAKIEEIRNMQISSFA